jgi:glycogen(starch) synthase
MTTHAGVTAAAAADAPLVATIHATERGRHQGYLPNDISATVDAVEHLLSHEATWVIACSRAMRAEVQRQFNVPADKISVIPNGIDTRHWRTTSAEREAARRRWAPHGPLLVFSGRLEAEKGIFTLIDALPSILAAHPHTQLVVAGQGGQSARFDEVVAERGLGGSLRRTGWLPEADLKALIAASDAAIIPSLYEPFGLVALEAMSLGAPVMCARTGGLADIVTEGQTGLLFHPGDPADLARAALAILDDPSAAAHRATLATASLRVQFDWRVIARDTVAVYEYLTAAG